MRKHRKLIAFFLVAAIIMSFAACSEKSLAYQGTSLAAGTVGDAYTASVNTATGAESVTYSLKSGSSLPEGLSLSSDGTISGTPTAAGDVTFTVVSEAKGYESAEAQFSISIAQPSAIEYAGSTLTIKEGESYSGSVATATAEGASITYAVTGGELPAGLSLAADGTVSGTPAEAATATVEVTASAEGYDSVSAEFVIQVIDANLHIFEAENVLLEWVDSETNIRYYRQGSGYSNSCFGLNMLINDAPIKYTNENGERVSKTAQASGGYYISGMYIAGSFIDFEIISDRDVEGAELYARLTAEYINPVCIAPEDTSVNGVNYWSFLFEVINLGDAEYDSLDPTIDPDANPDYYTSVSTVLDYEPILLVSTTNVEGDPVADFQDYLISTEVNLVEGLNIIRLRTNNDHKTFPSGTIYSVAPMVDCISIKADAELTMHTYDNVAEKYG